jgi:O-antigen/teichoic acid export membrane protein
MIKNIIANFIGRFWSILSNFLFIPLYIHILGFESYSIISFTLVIAGLMAVIDSGLTATLSREFARNDNSREEKIRIFNTLENVYFGIIATVIVVVVLLSGAIASKWLNLNAIPSEKVSFYLKIISFDIGFQLLLRFYTGGLLGLEKQVKVNVYLVGWGILRNGIVVIIILINPSLGVFFTWQAGSTFFFALLVGLLLKKELIGKLEFNFKMKIETTVLKRIWRFAGGMLLISLVAGLNSQMDKLAISKLFPVESLGYYTLAVSLSMGIIVLVNPISTALLPRFTALYSTGKSDEASNLFHKINILVAIMVFSVMANMSFFASDLIWIWTGKSELSKNASQYVPMMALSAAMLAIATIPYNIAIANGYTKLNNLLGILSLVITLPGYWLTTKQFGPMGAAVTYCVVQTTITVIYIFVINSKFLHEKRWSKIYFNQIILPLVVSSGLAFTFSSLPNIMVNNRILSLIWVGITTFLTLIITIFILMKRREIKSFLSQVKLKNSKTIK